MFVDRYDVAVDNLRAGNNPRPDVSVFVGVFILDSFDDTRVGCRVHFFDVLVHFGDSFIVYSVGRHYAGSRECSSIDEGSAGKYSRDGLPCFDYHVFYLR